MTNIKEIQISTEYITLGQFLKFIGFVDSGFVAKLYLQDNFVIVNDVKENRRGRKLYPSDIIVVENKRYLIK